MFQHFLKICLNFRSNQLMDTADFMYILPPFRFTSYAIGIFTGFAFRKARHIKVSSTQLYFAWILTLTTLFLGFRLTAELTDKSYQYNRVHAAAITFLSVPFCSFFALLIFTAEMNFSSEFVNRCFSNLFEAPQA